MGNYFIENLAPILTTGLLTLLGTIIATRSSSKAKELELKEQSKGTDLDRVRAASEEWRELYQSLRNEIDGVKSELDETKARISILEQTNSTMRSLLRRFTAVLEWVKQDECYSTHEAPENIDQLIQESQSLLS